jgi:hypothetical protein
MTYSVSLTFVIHFKELLFFLLFQSHFTNLSGFDLNSDHPFNVRLEVLTDVEYYFRFF